jgi:cysteine desulfurase/selenocysteine lyase
VDGADLLAEVARTLARYVILPEGAATAISLWVLFAHAHDLGTFVDRAGVAVRVGHHCAQPLMDALGVPSTNRASFWIYNTMGEAESFVEYLGQVVKRFA